MEDPKRDKLIEALKLADEHLREEDPYARLTRDRYRRMARKYNLEFKSDSPFCRFFGSWDEVLEAGEIETRYEDVDDVYEVGNTSDDQVPFLTRRIVPPNRTWRILVIPDLHAPFYCRSAYEAALQVGERFGPNEIVNLGDLVDCYPLSRFPKKRERESNFAEEIAIGKDLLVELKERTGAERCTILEGNHEARLRKYLFTKAPELAKIKALSINNLLDLEEIGWRFIPEHKFYAVNDVYFTHGEFCTIHAAKKHMDEYRVSIVHGHTHRISCRYHKGIDGVLEGWEMGCLTSMDVASDYVKRANWQHCVGTIIIQGRDHWITPHHIRNGRVEFEGEIIDGNM